MEATTTKNQACQTNSGFNMNWKQLSATRLSCQRIYAWLAVPIFLIIGLQMFFGLMPGAWWQIIPAVLPLFMLELLNWRLKPNAAARIKPWVHHFLTWGTGVYLVAILLTLFYEPIATKETLSIFAYREQMFYGLAGLSLPLLAAYVWVFFLQKYPAPFQPATHVAPPSQDLSPEEKEVFYELLRNNRFPDLFSVLRQRFSNHPEYNQYLVLIESSYNDLITQNRRGAEHKERDPLAPIRIRLMDIIEGVSRAPAD